jgi:hypothetical protein
MIVEDQALEPLVSLLKEIPIHDARQNSKVVAAAAATIWNLGTDMKIKDAIVEMDGSNTISHLIKLLDFDSDAETEQANDEVRSKAAGALAMLSEKHTRNANSVSTCIPKLKEIILVPSNKVKKRLIRSCLGCLAVLARVPECLAIMRELEFDTVVRCSRWICVSPACAYF